MPSDLEKMLRELQARNGGTAEQGEEASSASPSPVAQPVGEPVSEQGETEVTAGKKKKDHFVLVIIIIVILCLFLFKKH